MKDRRSRVTRFCSLRAAGGRRLQNPKRHGVSQKGRFLDLRKRPAERRQTNSGEAPCEIRFSWPAGLLAASIVVGGIGAYFLSSLL